MSINKLSNPLVIGGGKCYPITTTDQVIKSNGERLETDKGINSDTLENYSLSEILNKIYPVGSVYVTQTNDSPASYLGGTWELFDKCFAENVVTGLTDCATLNSNCSATTITLIWHDHIIRAIISFTPTVAITDSTLEMFTFNLSKLGVTQLAASQAYSSMTDGGQSVIVFNITDTGLFTTRDIITRASDTASLSGYTLIVTADLIANHADMLDDFCDKFYWKRID